MTQKLSQMKSSIASLVNTQKHTTDELTKQKKWQTDISSQLSKVAQGQIALGEIAKQLTDDNKIRDAREGRIDAKLNMLLKLATDPPSNQAQVVGQKNSNMEGQNNYIMGVTQGSLQSQPHPANLITQTQNNFSSQQLIPPPPRQGREI